VLALALVPSAATANPTTLAEEAAQRGEWDAAVRLYRAAAASETDASARDWALARAARAQRKLGGVDEVRSALQAIVIRARTRGDRGLEGFCGRNLGRLARDLGHLEEAETHYRDALRAYGQAGLVADTRDVRISIAALAHEMGRTAKAYQEYFALATEAQASGDLRLEALATEGLASCWMVLEQPEAAEFATQEAERLYTRLGMLDNALSARAGRCTLLNALGRFIDARAVLADTDVGAVQNVNVRAQLLAARLETATGLGESDEALESVAAALRSIDLRETGLAGIKVAQAASSALLDAGHPMWALRVVDEVPESGGGVRLWAKAGVRGSALYALGRHDEAARVLREAARAFEEHLAGSEAASIVDQRVGVFRELYAPLARVELARARPDAALEAVSRIKARGFVQQFVARSLLARDGESARMLATPDLEDFDAVRAGADAWLGALRSASIEGVRRALGDRMALLDVWLDGPDAHIFLVDAAGVQHRYLRGMGTRVEATARALNVAMVRRTPDWTESADRLSTWLLSPFRAELDALALRGGTLGIAAQGPLHLIPWAALPLGKGQVIDALPLFQVPNIFAAGITLRRPAEPREPRRGLVAVGDIPAPSAGLLLGARREMAALGRLYGAQVIRGADATEAAFRRAFESARMLHVVVHGYGPADGHPSYLELAPGDRDDGHLQADEVSGLQGRLDMAFLASCDSGLGRPNAGDDMPEVLDRAFLLGGTRTVVSARWLLDDDAATVVVERFYASLAERGAAHALAVAQRHARSTFKTHTVDSDGEIPARTHPFYWAGFGVVGDPR
jgi:CHAT domain-containing protein